MSTPRNVMEKNAKNKLTLLQLAEKLGSVTMACRHLDFSRSQFYELKRRFELEGFQGLIDRPPIPKSHPQQKTQTLVNRVLDLSRQYPAWGKEKIAVQLRLEGFLLCSTTVYHIWKKNNLTKRLNRWLWASQTDPNLILTEEQLKDLECLNPCLRERHVESPRPGFLLCQDTFYVGCFKGIGRVYMQAIVDTYCSLAFARLYTSKTAITAVELLYNWVIPFYQQMKVPIEHILTDNGSEYCGRPKDHPYELNLILHGIKHRRTKIATPRTNGFVERFNRTVLEEFFRGILQRKYYSSLVELQNDLDQWLEFYNNRRPHLGYRNQGKMPRDAFNAHVKSNQTVAA